MTLDGLLVHDVTIVTPGTTTDRYANTVLDWGTATSVTAKGWVSQRSADEVGGDRDAFVSGWVLFLLPDVTITAADRVMWDGSTFEVDGPPNPASSPRGPHHIEVPLRVVEG